MCLEAATASRIVTARGFSRQDGMLPRNGGRRRLAAEEGRSARLYARERSPGAFLCRPRSSPSRTA